ncbi:MAG: hypothetical protein CVU11_00735 [Bacteroidetes bacterium HGW-Bacteroidetes-6]|nr:MAG: hypothetical protein CVU11_00735 [Bacteroidetes bacterium HGW-Bacteroidetes-6]
MNDKQMKKVLLISDSILSSDPRLLNQKAALSTDFTIHTLGIGSIDNRSISHSINSIFRKYKFHLNWNPVFRRPMTFFLGVYKSVIRSNRKKKFSNNFEFRYWQYVNLRYLKKIKNLDYDLVWANDIEVLPIAVFLCSEKTKLVFDAHEYFPMEQADSDWINKHSEYRKYLFDTHKSAIDKMITVSESISKLFFENFSITPEVILNAKPYFECSIKQPVAENIHLVHHGFALPGRNLEQIIELFNLLDSRFFLHFYLKDSAFNTLRSLKNLARGNSRIVFHKPVKTTEIIQTISQHDVGVYLMKNIGLNEENALPNKLFECIQARLMLIYPTLIEIRKIVENYNIGIVSDAENLTNLASKINALTPDDILAFKKNTELAAKDLCAENELEKMRKIANDVLL